MQTDVYLVLGIVMAALGFPALLNAFSESRFPRLALLLFLFAAVLIVMAVTGRPGGYAIDDIPQAFVRVIGWIIN
jgi:uncharacterized membrane protein